jgi:hypothetical protein
MSAKPQRLNEEPYMGKLFVRFREGPGSNLPGLLEVNLAMSHHQGDKEVAPSKI